MIAKLIFSSPETDLLQSSVWRDPSEIIIICWFDFQETALIIIVVNSNIFVETTIFNELK